MRVRAVSTVWAIAALVAVLGFLSSIPAADLVPIRHQILPMPVAPPRVHIPPSERVPSKVHTALDLTEETVDWGMSSLNLPAAWAKTEGAGVVVAVLDTGISATHKDLANQIKGSKDFTNSKSGTDDRVGHGTHCAGVIAAEVNGWGMCGVARKSKILAYKVLDDTGSGGVDQIAAGIDAAVKDGADVISASFGGPGKDAFMPAALDRAEAAGVIFIAAAGNSGPGNNTVGYPGAYPTVIAVAAVDSNSAVANFSSRGTQVFVSAPGVNVRSCYPGPGDGLFATMSGTSMACPHVAGLAALWISANPTVAKKDRPAKFRAALQAACKDLPPVGRDTASGYGLPDAWKLVGGTGPVIPPVVPGSVQFGQADFSADGWLKLQRIAPGVKTVTFGFGP